MVSRMLKHLFMPSWLMWKFFPPAMLAEIETAIRESEMLHSGEIPDLVEGPPIGRKRILRQKITRRPEGLDGFAVLPRVGEPRGEFGQEIRCLRRITLGGFEVQLTGGIAVVSQPCDASADGAHVR